MTMLTRLAPLAFWGLLATAWAGEPGPTGNSADPALPLPAPDPGTASRADLDILTRPVPRPVPLSFADARWLMWGLTPQQALSYLPSLRQAEPSGPAGSAPGGGAVEGSSPDWRLIQLLNPVLGSSKAEERDFDGKAGGQLDGPRWSLKSQLQVEAASSTADIPGAERWQTEEALNVPVAGPVYLLG